jgi:hypothetical protein
MIEQCGDYRAISAVQRTGAAARIGDRLTRPCGALVDAFE